jgi:hypothetical protein
MGAKCRVEVELVAAGRTMAHVTGVIRDMEGRVCVVCMIRLFFMGRNCRLGLVDRLGI